MSTAIPRAEAPADPPADATPEPAPAKRTLVQRVPAPVFITVYGVLVVAVIVAGAMLASYAQRGGETPSQRLEAASRATTEAEAEAADPETAPPTETAEPSPAEPPLPEPRQPFNPPPADEANVLASIRRHLITDVQTSAGDTGVLMRGTIAGDLETQLPELSGHISRLLEQNCIDALTLKTADNLRLSFYGFCFSTIPETTISQLATLADEQDAEAMIIMDTHSSSAIEAEVVWLDVPDARLNSLELVWRDQIRPAGIKRLRFAAYGETEAAFYENPEAARTRQWRDPTGDAVPRAVTKSA